MPVRWLSRLPSLAAIWAVIAGAAVFIIRFIARAGQTRRDHEALQEEVEHARDIRDRVDDARRDHDDGVRPHEGAGWRD